MSTPHTRLTAWNEGDTDAIPDGYGPEALDWQRDLRAVLAIGSAPSGAEAMAVVQALAEEEVAKYRAKYPSVDAIPHSYAGQVLAILSARLRALPAAPPPTSAALIPEHMAAQIEAQDSTGQPHMEVVREAVAHALREAGRAIRERGGGAGVAMPDRGAAIPLADVPASEIEAVRIELTHGWNHTLTRSSEHLEALRSFLARLPQRGAGG